MFVALPSGSSVRTLGAVLLLFAVAVTTTPVVHPASSNKNSYRGMVWHAEELDGTEIDSRDADRTINPASIVKIATSLWALERLGPEHRFETAFMIDGDLDPETGELDGDLLVIGGGDPDFQRENAFLIALRLNEMGLKTVLGDLRVSRRFWIGWEEGSSHRLDDPDERARLMASRLRSAMDPHRWDRSTQRAWRKLAARRGLPSKPRPRVAVRGSYGPITGQAGGTTLLIHRSKAVVDVLRRFNCFSNNDIERIGENLGPASDLALMLQERWSLPDGTISFETTSGLGSNRITPRLIVRLVRELAATCDRLGVDLADVLPVAGCDPGTLRAFPRLNGGEFVGSVTGKTGSLVYTDGGVAVFAGVAATSRGDVVFCVAMPRAGRKLHWARSQEESWLLELIDSRGGPDASTCGLELPMPDNGAEIVIENRRPVAIGPR
jgi:D-alanyl-D-alanine carboxypeptidase/D-alanyl-D-alanine-endopeptidase (penicillin-binding protein 4)